MRAYYNEIEPFAAAWLRELMADGLIMAGDVDDRSITDVEPADLVGYTRCHFFAGIGGWDYALRLAGWPDDRPVWTGSCPCQPFSAAGKGEGFNDPRHLWPAFFRLIRESRPVTVFGEQVSSNLAWLDLVCGDLEGEGYAVGSVIVGAHSVGAPHLRQRLYWVADAEDERWERGGPARARRAGPADAGGGVLGRVGNALDARLQGHGESGWVSGQAGREAAERHSAPASPWTALDWLPCRDGKARPTQPGLQPLAHGVSNRVGLLRGAGNAIVAPLAAQFIKAYLEC